MKILLTGFRPYATHTVNPSEVLLGQIHRDGVKSLLLPVEYESSKREFDSMVEEYKPDVVLVLALSPFCHRPTLEQYAYNEMDSIQPDEIGVTKTKEEILIDGAKSFDASFDTFSIQQYILSQGAKCDISIDPGRFVANEIYYESLSKGLKTLLLHVPAVDDYPIEDSLETVELILEYVDY